MTLTIGIYLYDDVEILDFAGPFEVFSTAARVFVRQRPDEPPPFRVLTIAATSEPVRGRGGLEILPHYTTSTHPYLDVLLIPGGVHDPELQKPEIIAWIARTARTVRLTASVCTGAFLLAKADLLHDKPVTTHWEDIDELEKTFPQLKVVRERRWVEAGDIVTSAGISAGIDMSLYLVSRLVSHDLAKATALQMEYVWRDS